jgi:hypothetical protein
LEDANRIVRAEDSDGRTENDTFRSARDRSEDHLRGRNGKIRAVVLADSEGIEPDILGENRLFNDVSERLGLRHRAAIFIDRNVAERIQTHLEHARPSLI